MGELIDREALCAELNRRVGSPEGHRRLMEANQCICDAPAVDAAPVVHGRWIDESGNPVPWMESMPASPDGWCKCSACGTWLIGSDEYPCYGYYCPACGARMDA